MKLLKIYIAIAVVIYLVYYINRQDKLSTMRKYFASIGFNTVANLMSYKEKTYCYKYLHDYAGNKSTLMKDPFLFQQIQLIHNKYNVFNNL